MQTFRGDGNKVNEVDREVLQCLLHHFLTFLTDLRRLAVEIKKVQPINKFTLTMLK